MIHCISILFKKRILYIIAKIIYKENSITLIYASRFI
jgi:hypothetical protein